MSAEENDPLRSVLQEAEDLMEDIETENDINFNIDGFAIDDHDEEDVTLNPTTSKDEDDEEILDPLSAAAMHPLQDSLLHVDSAKPTAASSTSSMTPAVEANGSSASIPPPKLDAFKAQTTRFASNLANMAQRAASQAVAVATTAAHHPSPLHAAAVTPVPATVPTPQPQLVAANATSIQPATHPQSLNDKPYKEQLLRDFVGDLYPGEQVIMFIGNLLHVSDSTGFVYSQQQNPNLLWCCAMTYYRIVIFGKVPPLANHPSTWNPSAWPQRDTNMVLQMPLASVDHVEKTVYSTGTTYMGLTVYGKDNDRWIRFTTPSYADTLKAHEALNTYAFPGRRNLGYLFAFESKRSLVTANMVQKNGQVVITLPPTPRRLDYVQEFTRQFRGFVNNPWSISQVNANYQVCPTYPNVLVGPACLKINDDGTYPSIWKQCAAFRSEQRLPALTWCSGRNGASLWRCSQPKIGLQGNRSQADELFLKHIMESAKSANALASNTEEESIPLWIQDQLTGGDKDLAAPNCFLKIMDLRPRSSAMANRTAGYGYENTSNYAGTALTFCNIGNIHAVRDSYQKLSSLCHDPNSRDVAWNSLVEDTKWLAHIRLILAASWETAYWLQVHKVPVLLHCSHGWDRTSQVAALAQLLLDDHYRSCKGFATLVEKDFLSFGHPFHTRCSHGEGHKENAESQVSPIFIQFLDCVYQLVNQYPESFEFNADYVLELSEHVYSCRFGTLLCDTEREREYVAGIRLRTFCLWDYLEEQPHLIRKAPYQRGVLLMPLSSLLRNVTLWQDRHCRYGPKVTKRWMGPSSVPQGSQTLTEPLDSETTAATPPEPAEEATPLSVQASESS